MAKKSKVTNVVDISKKKRGRKPKVKANGSDPESPAVQAAEAITDSVRVAIAEDEGLGPISLPEPEDAVKVLKELAGFQALRARWAKIQTEHAEKAKAAKAKVEGIDEQIAEKIRVATRQTDLPLFSQAQSEADVAQIQEASTWYPGGKNGVQVGQPVDEPVTDPAPEVAPLSLPEAPESPTDDETPF